MLARYLRSSCWSASEQSTVTFRWRACSSMIRGSPPRSPLQLFPFNPRTVRGRQWERFDDITGHRGAGGRPALPLPLTSGIVLMRRAASSSVSICCTSAALLSFSSRIPLYGPETPYSSCCCTSLMTRTELGQRAGRSSRLRAFLSLRCAQSCAVGGNLNTL